MDRPIQTSPSKGLGIARHHSLERYSTEGHFIKGASSDHDVPRLNPGRQDRMEVQEGLIQRKIRKCPRPLLHRDFRNYNLTRFGFFGSNQLCGPQKGAECAKGKENKNK